MASKTPRVFDTDKRIRLGIWGLGRGMSFYSTCAMLNVDVVAGCDYNEQTRKRFLEANPGAFVTADAAEFLAQDLDSVTPAKVLAPSIAFNKQAGMFSARGGSAALSGNGLMDHSRHACRGPYRAPLVPPSILCCPAPTTAPGAQSGTPCHFRKTLGRRLWPDRRLNHYVVVRPPCASWPVPISLPHRAYCGIFISSPSLSAD